MEMNDRTETDAGDVTIPCPVCPTDPDPACALCPPPAAAGGATVVVIEDDGEVDGGPVDGGGPATVTTTLVDRRVVLSEVDFCPLGSPGEGV